MRNKRITVSDLARMVKSGFDFMHEQFQKIDERFNQIDERFNLIDRRFDAMDLEFARVNRRLDHAVYQPELDALERRVGRLEKRAGLA